MLASVRRREGPAEPHGESVGGVVEFATCGRRCVRSFADKCGWNLANRVTSSANDNPDPGSGTWRGLGGDLADPNGRREEVALSASTRGYCGRLICRRRGHRCANGNLNVSEKLRKSALITCHQQRKAPDGYLRRAGGAGYIREVWAVQDPRVEDRN